MLQLIYISTATPAMREPELTRILSASRRNNARDGISGLLFFNGRRFLQALEGPAAVVETAIARIKADDRHAAVVTLSRREVDTREFGDWAMASLGAGEAAGQAAIDRVDALTIDASPSVRAQFTSFARLQSA
ncbi:BLUF domain-containing protein [Sphingomonas sp. BAUL-RG-20F-R05-02]|uniref:BLUF domain-containing protein n=1 Tax=Sphingomonas sp. BAUL-RG-20F-R05-02 TaxID=2914830 RepID=UPI001F5A6D9E|nr:BLUF domain-containing protein [Sphingomonas sp. BAUL-RG-20F-R05-02]